MRAKVRKRDMKFYRLKCSGAKRWRQTVRALDAEAMTTVIIASITRTKFENLPEGISFLSDRSIILYKKTGKVRATRNKCKHQGGCFIEDIEDTSKSIVKCTNHGWKLDLSKMTYVNPPQSFCQKELEVDVTEDMVFFTDELDHQPWGSVTYSGDPVQEKEMTVTYLCHACVEIRCGEFSIITDPWLTGPAFGGGWWLLHEPPPDWLDRISSATCIYISHRHSDHLSTNTLQKLAERNPNIPIYVANTQVPVFSKRCRKISGMRNIRIVELSRWIQVSEYTRLMILPDAIHSEMDTCLLLEYKGKLILNTVDCSSPNSGVLPERVDLLLTDFAGGAAGFPVIFGGGKYTEEWKNSFMTRERKKIVQNRLKLIETLQPRIYCPFAGYFVEANPRDRYVKEKNIKNSAADLCKHINTQCPGVTTWIPKPGDSLDIVSGTVTSSASQEEVYKSNWDFASFDRTFEEARTHPIFNKKDWWKFYFEWAAFRNYDLVLQLVEANDNFEEDGINIYVDFQDLSFPVQAPSDQRNFLKVVVRKDTLRETVLRGLSWDDIYIGFQSRISRHPDIYHHKFWNHFQLLLPEEPPAWSAFSSEQKNGNEVARRAEAQDMSVSHKSALCNGLTYKHMIVPILLMLIQFVFGILMRRTLKVSDTTGIP